MRSFTVILFAALSACLVRAADHCEGASVTRNDNNNFALWKGVESNWTCPETPCETLSQTKNLVLVNKPGLLILHSIAVSLVENQSTQ